MSNLPLEPPHAQLERSGGPAEYLGDAIAHCEVELRRLALHKYSPVIVLWLEMSGYAGQWERLDRAGFRDLYKFLKRCER